MRNRSTTTTFVLLTLIIGGTLAHFVGDRLETGETRTREEALACEGDGCGEADPATLAPIELAARDACSDVGYLCARLEAEESFRVIRLEDDLGRLRIRLPLPEHEPPAVARRLQEAVRRGISTWDGRPFEIVVDTRRRSVLPADIEIEWVRQLGGNRLGVTSSTVGVRGRELFYKVDGLSLATRSPGNLQRVLNPEQVMLTAAHEMGHVLGLPHSDEPRDVMYELNTARALTNRDYRTMLALYELPRGAVVVRR